MAKKTKEYVAIRVSPESKEKVKILSLNLGKPESIVCNNLIDFAYKTGVNFHQKTLDSIPDLFAKYDNKMVGFLRTRETLFFKPMEKTFQDLIKKTKMVFDGLETLNIVDFSDKLEDKKQDITFKSPDDKVVFEDSNTVKNTNDISSSITENEAENITDNQDEKLQELQQKNDTLLDQLERIEKERNHFKSELVFLLEKIKPNSSFGGAKFICNITNKELENIKNLLK